MITPELRAIFRTDDGSLPDINFDFGGARVVAQAYSLLQSQAAALASEEPGYWSTIEQKQCAIQFGDNPAACLVAGEAEAFHVVFGGVKSRSGRHTPDLGVFVLGPDFLALDYRMGTEWDDEAISGLLEIMAELSRLAASTVVTHEGNDSDPDGTTLVSAWRQGLIGSDRLR